MLFVDAKKAHLNGKVPENEYVYVEAPEGTSPPGKCWKLKRWLYGMRPAAHAWEIDYSNHLKGFGMSKGLSAPTVFYCEEKQLRCVVRGDDFAFLGWDKDLDDVVEHMKKAYELKVRGKMSGDPKDAQEITILNRKLTWKGNEMTYEADLKHVEKIIEEMGLDDRSNGLTKPYVRELLDEEPLDESESKRFRALAARANYLAQDRADIQFAVKEACRDVSSPSTASWTVLKRIAKYLLSYPRLIWRFGPYDVDMNEVQVFSDSDWAGCLKTRRSTSGGVVMLGGAALKHWSSTQSSIALSSGEAELVAMVKAMAEGLGIQALAADLGWRLGVRVFTDSSAAKSIACRMGIGRVRHLETRLMWVQEAVATGKGRVSKIPGKSNMADILTKGVSLEEIEVGLESMNLMLSKSAHAMNN